MPAEIVIETCPAPVCNLAEQDVEQFLDEMKSYIEMFEPAFQRAEQLEWSKAYLQGLLGDALRKNVEQMALRLGEKVRSMQYFIGQSPWKAERVVAMHQKLVAESLGEADGVALIDESGVIKQGEDSVGVGAQYCGSPGKIANSQVGVYLGYAICDFSFLRSIESRNNMPGPEIWLIIRRNREDPSIIKFYFSNSPANTSTIIISWCESPV